MLMQSELSRSVPGPVLGVLRVSVATLWAKLTILPRLELGCRGPRGVQWDHMASGTGGIQAPLHLRPQPPWSSHWAPALEAAEA